MSKLELRKKIGMIFQSFNLFSNLTVLKNLTLAPIKTGLMKESEAEEKAIHYLNIISLLDKKDVYPDKLSGGQKQRVAIIRSLMMNPDILLIDEPTSALDSEMIKDVLELLKKVARDGMTMIIVSHELDFAKEIASRIIFMDYGKIIESGTPEDIFKNPKTERLKEFLSNIN
jgi:polar amino acid transport system ATP-binding protein